jgi:hypothetical protein
MHRALTVTIAALLLNLGANLLTLATMLCSVAAPMSGIGESVISEILLDRQK